jgi:hypothetical protein
LFPDYEKNGKVGKFKDKLVEKELFFGLQSFSEVPYAKFSLFATPACILVIGSRVPAIVTVQHLRRSESLVNPPDLFLRRIKVQLNSIFNTFVPDVTAVQQSAKESVHLERENIILCDKKYEKDNGQPLYDGLNLLDIVDVKLANEEIVPSFTSYGLNLEHELQIELWGECADREFGGIACTQPVQVVTEWHASTVRHRLEDNEPLEADSGPMYQELDPMAQMYKRNASREVQELEARPPAYELDSRHMASSSSSRVPPPEYAI